VNWPTTSASEDVKSQENQPYLKHIDHVRPELHRCHTLACVALLQRSTTRLQHGPRWLCVGA
jgi:hypothetical protein